MKQMFFHKVFLLGHFFDKKLCDELKMCLNRPLFYIKLKLSERVKNIRYND